MSDDKHDDDTKQSTLAKIVGALTAVAAAWVAQQVVAQGWKAATGHKPPKPEDEGDVRFREIATAAALTGAIVALSRVLATHGTAKFAARVNEKRSAS
ncbi:DUF4235 domain-containing protein [Cellulomonas sp. HZM]|uniref:DUF4235 domain-containing protein n=1 Tax=Cellulomonas sp. HZM TaxID=1454010 RepID=UPI0004930A91|nr:DUF4235 domain-containing protein [Cellulomonas sp. HZM]